MKTRWWFFLPLLFISCITEPNSNEWEGSYIGYYHQNQQDTTPVKLVFSGKYFAASPHDAADTTKAEGVFQQQQSTIVFHNVHAGKTTLLHGTYQYQYGADGSVRLWQEMDTDFREIILRQQ